MLHLSKWWLSSFVAVLQVMAFTYNALLLLMALIYTAFILYCTNPMGAFLSCTLGEESVRILWMKTPSWKWKGGRAPGSELGASVSFGLRRRQDVNLSEMRRQQRDKEDDPFTAQEYQHAQSKSMCIARERTMSHCNVHDIIIYPCIYCIYCSRKINHLVSEPFAFILWCKKPCREHFHPILDCSLTDGFHPPILHFSNSRLSSYIALQ
jgi:hypothetical protein